MEDSSYDRGMIRALLLLTVITSATLAANDRATFFENRIRPVLVAHCLDCHSADGDESGGLLLDSGPGWQRGGDSGAAIVAGQPEASRVLEAISYENHDLQMPPDNRLPPNVVADFRKWISDGAFDPRQEEKASRREAFDLEKRRREHWAWQPQQHIEAGRTIDSFIRDELERRSLQPSPAAPAKVLARRLYFDLIGLPPTTEQLSEFDAQYSVDADHAIVRLVDQLLESPRFGEKWASHWFDVVDYSETKGHVTDQERPFAWKYRDYVIDALNDDVPYDRFVIEHIAGDLLPEEMQRPGRNGETNISPTATGVLYMHEMHFMAVNPVQQRWDEIDAQIDMVGKAFLGLTLECARCHDHKFDAISQADYYALAGFFYSTEQGKQRTAPRTQVVSAKAEELAKRESEYEAYLEQKKQSRLKALTPKNKGGQYFPISEELGLQTKADTANVLQKMRAIEAVDPSWSHWVRAAQDVDGRDTPLLIRGEVSNSGDIVPRRFLTALGSPIPENLPGSGRMWLAEQIVGSQNSITPRVHVNRIWHHLFGRGIVATPNDFGKLGSPPSHPQLLDYLAHRLTTQNWSTKSVIREVVLSKTYQQSSQLRDDLTEVDPENTLFARQNRRRLTAEQLRDAMLLVSGSFNDTMYGPGVPPFVPPYTTANKTVHIPKSGPLDGDNRRSVYIKARRNFFDPFLRTFDFPDRGKPVGRRDVTIVPNQALAMLNSPLVHELAGDWASVISLSGDRDDEKLNVAWTAALGRAATEAELETARALMSELRAETSDEATSATGDSTEVWKHVAHLLFNHADFVWVE